MPSVASPAALGLSPLQSHRCWHSTSAGASNWKLGGLPPPTESLGRLGTSPQVLVFFHNRMSIHKLISSHSSYRRGVDLVVFVFFSLEYLHPEQGIQIAKGADGWPSAADDVTDVCHQAYRRTCGSSGWGNPACQQIQITSFIPRCQICQMVAFN